MPDLDDLQKIVSTARTGTTGEQSSRRCLIEQALRLARESEQTERMRTAKSEKPPSFPTRSIT